MGQTAEHHRKTLNRLVKVNSQHGRELLPRGSSDGVMSHAREVGNALATTDYSWFPKYDITIYGNITSRRS